MFRTVVIAANDIQLRWMQAIALQHRRLLVERCMDRYPSAFEVQQILGVGAPELIFLDTKHRENAFSISKMVQEASPRTAIVGLGDGDPEEWIGRGGIAAFVSTSHAAEEFEDAVNVALHSTRPVRHKALYSFMPAKAGNGCSTVVINTAVKLAARNRSVLVVEADLRSGTMEVALNAKAPASLQSLLNAEEPLDRLRWETTVCRLHGVHWLFSNRRAQGRLPEWTDYYQLLDFAGPKYDVVMVDLPELVNPATADIVRTSNLIFIVCTQEVLSLKLAEQRCEELSQWGVPSENVRILVNRWHSREFSREELQGILKHPVTATFPNDYPSCRDAIIKGDAVSPDTKLGSAFTDFVRQLDRSPEPAAESKSRFARLFSSLAGR